MLYEQEGPDGVDAEGVDAFLGVDLRGRFLGVQDAGDGEGKAEVVCLGWEESFGVGGCCGDAGLVWLLRGRELARCC